jgi:ABC-type multidrug transport system ATPase subunit
MRRTRISYWDTNAGNVTIQGNHINTKKGLQDARDQLGFCPQSNDFLFDNLSFQENYTLFSALRGLKNEPFPDNMVR